MPSITPKRLVSARCWSVLRRRWSSSFWVLCKSTVSNFTGDRTDNWMDWSVLSPFLSFKCSENQTGTHLLEQGFMLYSQVGAKHHRNYLFEFFWLTSGYIGEFEYIDDHRSGKIVVQLTGRLNKCGVISPRFNVKIGDIERWTDNLLPARQFGLVILTTSAGIMDHEEARRKHVSGKILGFVY